MDIDLKAIGARVKKRRTELHLTHANITELCGIKSSTLSRIEQGTNAVSIVIFHKISEVLQCDVNWLLTGKSPYLEDLPVSGSERDLLIGFRQLNKNDQEEIMVLMTLKLHRIKGELKIVEKSSHSEKNNPDDKLA